MMFDDKRNYRPDEVAERFNVAVRSVYRWIKRVERPLPAFRLPGGEIRISGRELNAYVERNRVDPLEE